MSDVEYKEQIEGLLGRPLASGELVPVRTLADLSDVQIAVVESLAPRHVILPLHYLRAIVQEVSFGEIRDYSDRVARRVRDRAADHSSGAPPGEDLPNAPLFEHYLGRVLEPAEKICVAAIHDLSPAHLTVASALLRTEPPVGFMYLHRVAPTSSIEERSKLATELTAK